MAGDGLTEAKRWTPDQLKFQAWLALPSSARSPKTQRQLATQLEVHEVTLSEWKRLPGWNEAVYDLAMEVIRGELTPILHAHAKLARKNLDSAKWLFELAGKWTPKQQTQSDAVIRVEYVNDGDAETSAPA